MKRTAHKLLYALDAAQNGLRLITRDNYHSLDAPVRIDIGLTNHCNERCGMCPNREIEGPRGFMAQGTFRALVDEMAELGVRAGGLGLFGEPTMHREIIGFLEYMTRHGMRYFLSTNGLSLDRELAGYLAAQGRGRVHVSIYAANADQFAAVHGVNGFERAVDNITILLESLAETGNRELVVFMNFLETPANRGGYRAWLDRWEPLLAQVAHVPPEKKNFINWGGRIEKPLGTLSGRATVYRRPCDKLFDRLAVDWDGRITACCKSWNDESLHLGNLSEQGLAGAWRGGRMRELREIMLSGNLSSLRACEACEETRGEIGLASTLRSQASTRVRRALAALGGKAP